jgi:hypothetical protein
MSKKKSTECSSMVLRPLGSMNNPWDLINPTKGLKKKKEIHSNVLHKLDLKLHGKSMNCWVNMVQARLNGIGN